MTQLQMIGPERHPNRHSAQDRARQDAWDRLGRETRAMVKAMGGTDRQAQQAAAWTLPQAPLRAAGQGIRLRLGIAPD